MSVRPQFFDIAAGVAAALSRSAPVVALESTIVSHGMPYPENLETALAVERIVRESGAVPATIAVVGGRVKIGLTEDEFERIGRASDVLKLSRADLPHAIAARRDGATTVAATMLLADLAGIDVFATGGVGGVHRGAGRTFDISADLYELARTPVTVVCSGAKALLDLPATLEMLETLGVPAIVYRSDEFPAFWSRESGLPSPLRYDSAREIAGFVQTQRSLGLSSGTLVANPVDPADQIPRAEMEPWIACAAAEAQEAGISGKAVTPWLLERISRLSSGRSLAANVALVKSNGRLAAEIAGWMSNTA
ncbi:MAG TPA: pseudouridine-5'-phosphate glycosidase [Candidatus Rubrimentiphilum sp.]|nr:pseudouridine-5'-phosphate glycosidase [Candidatus Rubrimentiphilum sp.]